MTDSIGPQQDRDAPGQPSTVGANPYLVGIFAISAVSVLIALVLYIIAWSTTDTYAAAAGIAAKEVAAVNWLEFGGIAFVAGLVLAGVGWYRR